MFGNFQILLDFQDVQFEFDPIVKIGRTHLQDAVPIRLGQEFSAYAAMMEHAIRRMESVRFALSELANGGTAVGTGLNCPPEFAPRVVEKLSEWTGISFREAKNKFEALASRDAAVEASGMLKTVAVSLMKIANDLRWLGSGPRCGIGELFLPATQPGSSIMPAKVNPVIPEAVTMIAAQVIGNDVTISLGGQSGNFELNVMKPIIAYNLLQSIHLISNGCSVLKEKCLDGLKANRERCEEMVELPGWVAGRKSSPMPQRGPEPSQRRSLAIFIKLTATGKCIPTTTSTWGSPAMT